MDNTKLANWFLRIALCVALVYPALSVFFDPIAWISFVPAWIKNLVNDQAFLILYSIFEILIALWLISGKKLYHAALVSAGLMFAITVLNLNAMEIVFRDISLGFAGLALAYLAKGNTKETQSEIPGQKKNAKLNKVLFAIITMLALGISIYFLTRPEKPAEFTGPLRELNVLAKSYSFTPSELHAKQGEKIKLNVFIADDFHDLVIDEFNARTPRTSAVATTTVEFIADKAGEFKYYCSVGSHRQLGMEGTLIVE